MNDLKDSAVEELTAASKDESDSKKFLNQMLSGSSQEV